MEPGANIKKLREAAGLSGVAVAQRAGIHSSIFSRMENGKLPVSLDDYTKVLTAIMSLRDEREKTWNEALAALGMGRGAAEPRAEAVA